MHMRSTYPLFPTDDGWPYPDADGDAAALAEPGFTVERRRRPRRAAARRERARVRRLHARGARCAGSALLAGRVDEGSRPLARAARTPRRPSSSGTPSTRCGSASPPTTDRSGLAGRATRCLAVGHIRHSPTPPRSARHSGSLRHPHFAPAPAYAATPACIDMTRRRKRSRSCASTTRSARLRLDPVPLDGPRDRAPSSRRSRARPSRREGTTRPRGDGALRGRARAGVRLERQPEVPRVHPRRADEGVAAVRRRGVRVRGRTAGRGSRAAARSSPRTRRCGGSPTWPACPRARVAASSPAGSAGQPLRARRRPARPRPRAAAATGRRAGGSRSATRRTRRWRARSGSWTP